LHDKGEARNGTQIVVASTDFDGKQSEKARIAAIDSSGTVLQLDRALVYGHWGSNFSTGIPGRVLTQVLPQPMTFAFASHACGRE
jgi:hypothetical protein